MDLKANIHSIAEAARLYIVALVVSAISLAGVASADTIQGQVLGGGAPIAKSTVPLWEASAEAPQQLAHTQAGDDGRFRLAAQGPLDSILYLVATGGQPTGNKGGGDNPAIALISVLGGKPPVHVVDQRDHDCRVGMDQRAIPRRHGDQRLRARPAHRSGQLPNFVDLSTGGYGRMIQDALNSTQTPTMANFATLSNVLAGCVTRVKPDACSSLFAARRGRVASCRPTR